MTEETQIANPKKRLKFIDMARSVAILLMLEGHFVDDTLMEVYRDTDNTIFFTWQFVRSFTAPVFLTVTGLIFVYLMLKKRDEGWFENIRIRKGFKRVVELLFWGLLVQWYAFHVLECISVGILSILLIYGLYKLIRFIPLWFLFMLAGILAFSLYPFVKAEHGGTTFVEDGWMSFLQWIYDSKRGTVAWFPILPFMGYTMFGAMIGTLLHDLRKHVQTYYFPTIVLVLGAIFFFFSQALLGGIDSVVDVFASDWKYSFIRIDWLFERFGMVLMELSVLIFIDKIWGEKIREGNLFLKVGQNTLTIYVLHMVLLYGSITSVGLNTWFHKNLGPWEAAIGAASRPPQWLWQ